MYYRIKQYDIDGQFILSETFKVAAESSGITISIQPNPSNKTVTVNHPQALVNQQLQVSNMQGVLMVKTPAASRSTQTILNTPTFPAGIYQLVWRGGKEKIVKRFVIK